MTSPTAADASSSASTSPVMVEAWATALSATRPASFGGLAQPGDRLQQRAGVGGALLGAAQHVHPLRHQLLHVAQRRPARDSDSSMVSVTKKSIVPITLAAHHEREADAGLDPGPLRGGRAHAVGHLADVLDEHQVPRPPGAAGQAHALGEAGAQA